MLIVAVLSAFASLPVADGSPWSIGAGDTDPRLYGELVRRELACAACHADLGAEPPKAPQLAGLSQRVRPDFVRRFLAAPTDAHPGTRMPALLAHLDAAERDAAALSLTHYLFSLAPSEPMEASFDIGDVAAGRTLFHTVGCVACHGPLDAAAAWTPPQRGQGETLDEDAGEEGYEGDEDGLEAGETGADFEVPATRSEPIRALAPLGHVGQKYTAPRLAAFLFEPLHSRPSGRMPDMGLTRAEARVIAAYLVHTTGGGGERGAAFERSAEQAARGRELFDALGCAACHELDQHVAPPRTSVGEAALDSVGCAAAAPGAQHSGPQHKGPRYAVAPSVRAGLAAQRGLKPSPADSIALEMTALRCDACHARDGRGGVDPALDRFFGTTQPDLGEEARIPPPLTHVGAKLQRDWLHKVLYDGARVRPYMTTRMPSFGEANLAPLTAALLAVDKGALGEYAMPVPEGDTANAARDGGRLLLGTTGLGCVTCHDFNGPPSPGFRGLDLITAPERLTPEWYARFLVAPQALRPGIVMPEAWPGGVAVHTGILGGDTDAQIRGIWYYLTQGRTAHDPPGIRPEPTLLTVDGAARVYRGRSRVAGFRGVAVGSREGLHYAFDAEVGALTALWRGEFVSVRWDGQGAGDFEPRAEPATLFRAVGVLAAFDTLEPWPTPVQRTKESPRDPDPLYARRHGYRYLGHTLDRRGLPTFRYMCGSIEVSEQSEVVVEGETQLLRRTLRFDAPDESAVHLRILAGPFTLDGPSRATEGRISAEWSSGTPLASRTDLVLSFELPRGLTTTTINYELR